MNLTGGKKNRFQKGYVALCCGLELCSEIIQVFWWRINLLLKGLDDFLNFGNIADEYCEL